VGAPRELRSAEAAPDGQSFEFRIPQPRDRISPAWSGKLDEEM